MNDENVFLGYLCTPNVVDHDVVREKECHIHILQENNI